MRRLVVEKIPLLKKAIAADAAFTGTNDFASFATDWRYIATETPDAGSGILGSNSDPHQATHILNWPSYFLYVDPATWERADVCRSAASSTSTKSARFTSRDAHPEFGP